MGTRSLHHNIVSDTVYCACVCMTCLCHINDQSHPVACMYMDVFWKINSTYINLHSRLDLNFL